jgi:hypothetical protein
MLQMARKPFIVPPWGYQGDGVKGRLRPFEADLAVQPKRETAGIDRCVGGGCGEYVAITCQR